MHVKARVTIGAWLGSVALTAACGTTVPLTAGGQNGVLGTSQSQLGTSTTNGEVTGGAAAAGSGALAPGGVGSRTHDASSPAASATATASDSSIAGRAPGTIGARGRGWDLSRVYVGIVTSEDTSKTIGVKSWDPGDVAAQAKAIAEALNAKGGVLGRKIVTVVRDIGTLDTFNDPSTMGESVCSYFTDDHPVIAVWNFNIQLDAVPTFRSCLAKRRVPLFTASARAIDDSVMTELRPFYYHTTMVSWDQLAPLFVQRLKAQGWFSGWDRLLGKPGTSAVRIGILVDSTPQGGRTARVLKEAFAAAGSPGALVYQYADAAQGQTASVQFFNGNGVTHVVVTDVELTAFQVYAEAQRYHPRYGITTYNYPYPNLEASGMTPKGANDGAMGVGWIPSLDVSDANDPGATARGRACTDTLRRAGISLPSRLARVTAFSLCDTLGLLVESASAGGGFSSEAIHIGIAQRGASFVPANGFSSALDADTSYLQGDVRDIAWASGCECFRYGPGGGRL